ncbi:hypothetical protein [Cryobacterium sp. PH31-L1]|uniref:hypothetical protein n=1 Tax=Cryobacterium sp. PH31-L1 TaxID=3046199 RepID=UPI0024B9AC7C|nr:hypothetical protein [Cryobacterium sp. PH31-L1]MDJ0378917.1 hypothetical protein [Cryobacterium sp. PH31-L1]
MGVKPGIEKRAEKLREAGVDYWFDPMTHALQMPGVGDYRYYSGYSLWGGPQGDITDPAYRDEHIRRVFHMQKTLEAPLLAPTVLLHTGLSNTSSLALELSRNCRDLGEAVTLSIAGSGSFWASKSDLDAHIGSLVALEPAGWFITFTHPGEDLPPSFTAEEIAGVCRTVRALSEYAQVYVSHGDFAALPAVAAGAYAVGTGWDKRQRMSRYGDYGARESGGQARWYARPTLKGLLGTLSVNEGALLLAQAPRLAQSLGGLPAPGPGEAFQHHVAQLQSAVHDLATAGGYEDRYLKLDDMYSGAKAAWALVSSRTGIRNHADKWIDPLQAGLRKYGHSEGWK